MCQRVSRSDGGGACYLFRMLLHILSWREPVHLLEHSGEACGAVESAAVHDFCDVLPLTTKQSGCLFQTQVADEVVRSLVGELFHLTMQMHAADAYLGAYHVDVQVAVAEVGVHNGENAVEELVVSTFNLDIIDLLAMVFLARELVLHEAA